MIAGESALILVALALAWLLGVDVQSQIEWEPAALLRGAAATLPMLVPVAVMHFWPAGPWADFRRLVEELVAPLFRDWSIVQLGMVSLLAGVGEEMLFRGVLQYRFAAWCGPWCGLLLASLLFGLMHFISPAYALYTTLVGIYLGLIWMFDGNLLVPIVAHGLYDFLALLYLTRR